MPSRIWEILPRKFEDLQKQLLFNRGIKTQKEIENFFNPNLSYYEKDLQIPNIKIVQKRIEKAIKNQELIIVYGDYDVDGVCACAILYKALSSIGAQVLPYIPHREKEGYGLSKPGLEHARDNGAALVITVDNGIVALEQAKFAKQLGLDLIITDHHVPLEKLPEAFSIVHSIKMCGAAVAWCLIRDLVSSELSQDLLQFVAIATVADLIPLVGLGRAFVVEGLKILKKTKNLGLIELAKQSGIILENIGTFELGFVIGPRLNAIGRLEHAIDALRLLCTKDPIKAKNLANLLIQTNSKRQLLTENALQEAKMLIGNNLDKKIHIVDSKNWSSGIIGLIAARITEEYFKPSVAIAVGETHSKGSARSIDGINIVELLRNCQDLLVDVGGHKGAAGFSIENHMIEKFKIKMAQLTASLKITQGALKIEALVKVKDLTKQTALVFESFAPFGMGNPRPLLATTGMQITNIKTVGGGKHLKFKVTDAERSRSADEIEAIAFGKGEMEQELKKAQTADLAYYLEINNFNGRQITQLNVRDIK